jgi:hypothetical protein
MPLAILAWVPKRGDYVAINVGVAGVLELAARGTSRAHLALQQGEDRVRR